MSHIWTLVIFDVKKCSNWLRIFFCLSSVFFCLFLSVNSLFQPRNLHQLPYLFWANQSLSFPINSLSFHCFEPIRAFLLRYVLSLLTSSRLTWEKKKRKINPLTSPHPFPSSSLPRPSLADQFEWFSYGRSCSSVQMWINSIWRKKMTAIRTFPTGRPRLEPLSKPAELLRPHLQLTFSLILHPRPHRAVLLPRKRAKSLRVIPWKMHGKWRKHSVLELAQLPKPRKTAIISL